MFDDFITIAITGLLAGFFFSMPIAGPISIIITSNALKGKLRFCTRTAIGAVIVEFFYVLIAVYGIAALYPYYKPIIPYLFITGAVVTMIIAYKIVKTRLKLENLSKDIATDKKANRGGMRTGIFLNLSNPSLFLGWLISSFMLFSFLDSVGFATGGLETLLNENVDAVSKIAGPEFSEPSQQFTSPINSDEAGTSTPSLFVLSIVYAFMVASGGLVWLYLYARLLVKYRDKMNIKLLERLIQSLGIALIILSIVIGYRGVKAF